MTTLSPLSMGNPTTSLALTDFKLLPGLTTAESTVDSIVLETKLCRHNAEQGNGFLSLDLPMISAPMQAVTNFDLAVAMAQLGGIGILPTLADSGEQANLVRAVKHYKAGFQTDIITLSPTMSLAALVDIIDETGYTTFPVTDTGLFHGRLLGVITDKDFDRRDRKTVGDRMRTDIQTGNNIDNLAEANSLMIKYGRGFLPIVSAENTLQSVVFKKDLDKHLAHPGANEDDYKRLRVGAAITTHPNDRERIQLLAEAQVDVFVIDASDGHSHFQAETIAYIKQRYHIPVIAGNVVTAEGFTFLAEAGADAVKVGMGIGSGCITLEVKATGRGQASALMEIARARDQHCEQHNTYIPLIADGSISSAADMVIALSLGADSVMMGNFFARCTEGAGKMFSKSGQDFKEYWMEGSAKARNLRRYHQTSHTFFEEGISGFVPHEGSVFKKVPETVHKLKSTFSTCGCATIDALHRNARLEQLSAAAISQSGVHGLITSL